MIKMFFRRIKGEFLKLVMIIILVSLCAFIGVNGFSNPFNYKAIYNYSSLDYVKEGEIIYYDIKEVNYIITKYSEVKMNGNFLMKLTFYDDELNIIYKASSFVKDGYNCFEVNDEASYLVIQENSNLQIVGGTDIWIDLKSTIKIIIGILLLLLLQYCIFFLKRRY